ncbi:MAG: transposase [Candidatus Nealsonbacteria bacterium]|nr:transposase [Candidatus Nealsonbacteria bacterium]
MADAIRTHERELFARSQREPEVALLQTIIRRSGHALNSYGKLTKRGSPYLRRALFIAANVARMFDPELKAYYEKKRSEGKCYTVATVATTRKLLSRIYAVLRRGTPFIPSKT